MATDGTIAPPLYSADSIRLVEGLIVRLVSGTPPNQITRAQGNSFGNVKGMLGVIMSGSVIPGGPAAVRTIGRQRVLMETGLTPQTQDTVYPSATIAGYGTNVAPGSSFVPPIGLIVDASNYSRDNSVVVNISIGVGGGTTGAQGPAGVQGAQGATGAGGPQGGAGAQGATGSGAQGASGAQGPSGAQGSTGGAQGATGAQGPAGSNGAQGATGAGAQGAQGAQGPGGGAQGATGATGSQGSAGAQGATGAGAQGSSGAQGAQGAVGSFFDLSLSFGGGPSPGQNTLSIGGSFWLQPTTNNNTQFVPGTDVVNWEWRVPQAYSNAVLEIYVPNFTGLGAGNAFDVIVTVGGTTTAISVTGINSSGLYTATGALPVLSGATVGIKVRNVVGTVGIQTNFTAFLRLT